MKDLFTYRYYYIEAPLLVLSSTQQLLVQLEAKGVYMTTYVDSPMEKGKIEKTHPIIDTIFVGDFSLVLEDLSSRKNKRSHCLCISQQKIEAIACHCMIVSGSTSEKSQLIQSYIDKSNQKRKMRNILLLGSFAFLFVGLIGLSVDFDNVLVVSSTSIGFIGCCLYGGYKFIFEFIL